MKPGRSRDGDRRTASPSCKVRRGLAVHRKHENAERELWRLRKSEEKVGKVLTEAETGCRGVSSLAQISAAFWD